MQSAYTIPPSVACLALPYFSTLSHERHNFQKKVSEYGMCILTFTTNFVWTISHSNKNWDIINVHVFMYNTHYSCQILMKHEFSQHIFKKYSYIKFYENPSNGNRTFPCRQTDGQTDMTKLRVAFTILWPPKNEKFMPSKYHSESLINNRMGKADQVSDPWNNTWWRSMPFQDKLANIWSRFCKSFRPKHVLQTIGQLDTFTEKAEL